MKKYFFAGLITLLPIVVSLAILFWLINIFTAPFLDVSKYAVLYFEKLLKISFEKHVTLTLFISRIFSILFILVVTFTLGLLARIFLVKILLRITNSLLEHIPIIKFIYSITKDVTKSVFSQKEHIFKQTTIIPFPQSNTYALGFITGTVPGKIQHLDENLELLVFVPTSPHPISGFVLLSPKKLAYPIDVSVEEAFKFIISCGAAHLDNQHDHPSTKS